MGYHPEVILSGRKVNDSIAKFIADKVVKLMISRDTKIKNSKSLVLGLTFKENCPDIRNTKVIDILEQLLEYGINVDVYDPWASSAEVMKEFNISLLNEIPLAAYDSIILAVSHKQFLNLDIRRYLKTSALGVVYDIKSFLPSEIIDSRL
jgi:UDP-N-acetyl-D-galactosamine dehydrogenase